MYYILSQKLLHFALRMLLHFASKVITFCITNDIAFRVESYYICEAVTFCGKKYYILRYYDILCQLLQFVA